MWAYAHPSRGPRRRRRRRLRALPCVGREGARERSARAVRLRQPERQPPMRRGRGGVAQGLRGGHDDDRRVVHRRGRRHEPWLLSSGRLERRGVTARRRGPADRRPSDDRAHALGTAPSAPGVPRWRDVHCRLAAARQRRRRLPKRALAARRRRARDVLFLWRLRDRPARASRRGVRRRTAARPAERVTDRHPAPRRGRWRTHRRAAPRGRRGEQLRGYARRRRCRGVGARRARPRAHARPGRPSRPSRPSR